MYDNVSQIEAVSANHPLIVAVAGPGSGKTRVLVGRVTRLLGVGVPARDIALVTYTNDAAGEIARRLPQPVGFVGTLHALMLRMFGTSAVIDGEQLAGLLIEVGKEQDYKGPGKAVEEAFAALVAGGKTTATPAVIVAKGVLFKLRSARAKTFDMILHDGLRALAKGTAPACSFDHLLVDEAQDMASIDAAIYSALPVANKVYVGDPDQAIFGFRGGSPDHLTALAGAKAGHVIRLETNYRNPGRVCYHAQKLIGHNVGRVEKATIAAPGAVEGIVAATWYESEPDELNGLVRLARDRAPESTAILCRTNDLVGRVANHFRQSGLKVKARQLSGLPRDWGKARALIAALSNPDSDLLVKAYLRLDGQDVARLAAQATARLQPLNATTLRLEPTPAQGVPEVLARHNLSRETVEAATRIVAKLPADATAAELQIAIQEIEHAGREDGEGYTVTTVHAAKGREWATVFMPGMSQDLFPGRGDEAEERRLAYVGITRASREVFLSFAATRKPQWALSMVQCVPSQFIEEAGVTVTAPTVAWGIARGQIKLPVAWEEATTEFAVEVKAADNATAQTRWRAKALGKVAGNGGPEGSAKPHRRERPALQAKPRKVRMAKFLQPIEEAS